ncbi:hypothetical protein [Oxynema aestuarii]|uniref:Uncharacterized protein n=1 Tax=Oxynema aestuarii AP17 TaxID=2064643 RepID=A0A6H1U3F1_9CYAN|nr:hypothetical protein [Oxynema aestuarii]QIZ72966.1 hypothetical protein HCG48_22140 [Oxynema aestuarii AP17]
MQCFTLLSFNLFIDPYGIFNFITIKNVNLSKIKQETNVRIFKSLEVLQKKPKILLLGSSRTDVGLNPRHVKQLDINTVYNLGILGANMYEVMRYFQQSIAVEPNIKKVILGIDFFMFNENRDADASFYEDLLEQKYFWSSFLKWTFSIDTVFASFETIQWNQAGKTLTPYDDYGTRNEKYFIRYNLPEESKIKGFEVTLKRFLEDRSLYKDYQLSPASLEYLKKIVETCKEKNIDLYIFISPSHVTQWEAIHKAGIWPIFEQWKREVVKISEVWDFSGYNSITEEIISDRMSNYLDSSHYSQAVGELIFQRLLNQNHNQIPSDFGTVINTDNIDDYLSTTRNQRALWLETNSQTVEFLNNINVDL